MENFYLAIVVVLLLLAFSDLIVGVSNDAVNFLNSAIGSKVAPLRIILIIAAAGILVGSTFSNGMMEVARNGIMNPESFTFNDILIIFLAVMITDVLLLDMFNTFGLPTSTTVSVVFELLGASVGMGVMVIRQTTGDLSELSSYINSERTLAIITGILLSVAISFIVGLIVQYIARIIFSFNYKKTIIYFGSLWGGLAITGITYFILIKGAKGSSFINAEQLKWINENSLLILSISFAGWTVLLQLLNWLFRVNALKVIVLFGTFALAMAFAGNDLVNFIGVPMAGYESYREFTAQQGIDGTKFTMEALKESVKTPTPFLLAAGIVMVLALWFSKKARTVTRTEISLGNQAAVNERFASSQISRSLVRIGVQVGRVLWALVPPRGKKWIESRFDDKAFKKQARKDEGLSFDLVRASVNLAVASSLIAFATSYKLPLSTTYVTFMVAMSTSLADRAWGKESAVYRISGVMAVIGGWFFTAFVAFSGAFLMVLALKAGGLLAMALLILLAIGIIIRTHIIHRRREAKITELANDFWTDEKLSGKNVMSRYNERISHSLKTASEIYDDWIKALTDEKRKKLFKCVRETRSFRKDIKLYKGSAQHLVLRLNDITDNGEYYFQMLDHLSDISQCLIHVTESSFDHVDNNHGSFTNDDAADLRKFYEVLVKYMQRIQHSITSGKFDSPDKELENQWKLTDMLKAMRKNHLKHLKSKSDNSRASLLYLEILSESGNLVHHLSAIVKTSRLYAELNK